MKKYLTEFIGAFFLTMTVVLCFSDPKTAPMGPFAVSGMFMALIAAGAPHSGGYFNPALTVAALIAGRMERIEALYLMGLQLLAGVVAASIGVYLHNAGGGFAVEAKVLPDMLGAVLAEFLGVFIMVYVMLYINSRLEVSPLTYALAMGFLLLSIMFAFDKLSGAYFNLATVLGACIAGLAAWEDLILYVIGGMFGAAAAATVFVNMKEA